MFEDISGSLRKERQRMLSRHKYRMSSSEEADIDRYVQKQLLLRQREKEAELEQKMYEKSQRDRNLRASRAKKPVVVPDEEGTGQRLLFPAVQELVEREEIHMRASKVALSSFRMHQFLSILLFAFSISDVEVHATFAIEKNR